MRVRLAGAPVRQGVEDEARVGPPRVAPALLAPPAQRQGKHLLHLLLSHEREGVVALREDEDVRRLELEDVGGGGGQIRLQPVGGGVGESRHE